jgi:hypothetical protein
MKTARVRRDEEGEAKKGGKEIKFQKGGIRISAYTSAKVTSGGHRAEEAERMNESKKAKTNPSDQSA